MNPSCTEPSFLHGAVGPFDLSDVTVGGNDVHDDGQQLGTEALELEVAMDVTNFETAEGIDSNGGFELAPECALLVVRDGRGGAIPNIARYGMKERVALDKKMSHTG